jgi:hypothetical protein
MEFDNLTDHSIIKVQRMLNFVCSDAPYTVVLGNVRGKRTQKSGSTSGGQVLYAAALHSAGLTPEGRRNFDHTRVPNYGISNPDTTTTYPPDTSMSPLVHSYRINHALCHNVSLVPSAQLHHDLCRSLESFTHFRCTLPRRIHSAEPVLCRESYRWRYFRHRV